ncbi:MAG: T9SS type A sorting domain-containing protein, partial [candidate division Zixibacteria bacterium]|nr:T9SS type A sorting domain-containing protein [candidate division Zixibacteria bacterium]
SGETSVNFVWSECGDNRLSDASNDTTFVADSVFDADGLDITDRTTKLPTLTGFPDTCSIYGDTVYVRNILFRSTIIVFGMPTDITQPCEQNKSLPLSPILKQNYPNPFNPTTVISFSIPYAEDWELEIVNLLGQHIKTFNGRSEPGNCFVEWNGRDAGGHPVASGVYLYRLTVDNHIISRKMLLVR